MAGPAVPVEHPPLQGSARVLGTVALSLATFMNVLDSSIANVSIPAIAGDVGASPSQATWVITSFGVANAIAVPLTGWLTQRFGAVRLWTTSVLLFVLASMLCGLATSLEALVAARVLQGLVAGPLMPLSQTLLMSSYPRAQMGKALALWGMTTLVAPVVGPVLGGWITDNISWPWIFYINVPVGLLAAAMTWGLYRHRETPRRKLPIDTGALPRQVGKTELGKTLARCLSTLLLRVQTTSSMLVPIELLRPGPFVEHVAALQMLQGLMTGVAIALLVYSILNAFSVRDLPAGADPMDPTAATEPVPDYESLLDGDVPGADPAARSAHLRLALRHAPYLRSLSILDPDGRVVASSDLLTVLPRHFVNVTGMASELIVRDLPMEMPPVHVDALWHIRQGQRSEHAWLRLAIAATANQAFGS